VTGDTRSGIRLATATPPGLLPDLARLAEREGFEDIWLPEDYFANGGVATVTAALAVTERTQVGLGIVSAMVRHPAVLAMEAASIEGMFPGRLRLGIGAGVPAWTDQMGLTPRSPITAIRDCVSAVRALIAGDTLDHRDEYHRYSDVALSHPVGPVPITLGPIGPNMLRLSGEIADATLLSVLASPPYVAWARQQVSEGMARSGRTAEHHPIATYALCLVDDDEERAREHIRPFLARMLLAMPGVALFSVPGVSDAIEDLLASSGPEEFANAIPDEWIDLFTVVGPVGTCARKIEALRDSGADQVVLAPAGPARPEHIEAAAAVVRASLD